MEVLGMEILDVNVNMNEVSNTASDTRYLHTPPGLLGR